MHAWKSSYNGFQLSVRRFEPALACVQKGAETSFVSGKCCTHAASSEPQDAAYGEALTTKVSQDAGRLPEQAALVQGKM